MTISKKFVTMAVFALGMQTVAQGYDVVGLKKEVAQISKYAKKYSQNWYTKYWLKQQINSTYMTSNHKIATIANIITSNSSIETKDQELNAIIERERLQRVAIGNFMGTVGACLYITGVSIIIGDGIYRRAINMIEWHDFYLKQDILDNVQNMIAQKMTFPDVLLWS